MAEEHAESRNAEMRPCRMAVSVVIGQGSGDQTHLAYRRWRALSLDNQSELCSGRLVTNADDSLRIVRDKAMASARQEGYDPQSFILEKEQVT